MREGRNRENERKIKAAALIELSQRLRNKAFRILDGKDEGAD